MRVTTNCLSLRSVSPNPSAPESPKMISASLFKQNFNSGVNYLRRRFSSDDLYRDKDDDIDLQTSAATNSAINYAQPGQPDRSISASHKLPSAPNFPSMSSVQGILSHAAAAASSAVNAAAQGAMTGAGGSSYGGPVNPVAGNSWLQSRGSTSDGSSRERCRTLLIIDDKHTDW